MYTTTYIVLGSIAVLAIAGIHIPFAFAIASAVGLMFTLNAMLPAAELMHQATISSLNSYTLVVLPLFSVMGIVIGDSGAAGDVFHVINKRLRTLPGRLAVATVCGNTVFAAVTGVGATAAVAFSRIAYPEMKRRNYADSFSTGVIVGSCVLGLLIPPSVFMIIMAILTEQSVGRLFMSGVGPGLLLAVMFAGYCIVAAFVKPDLAPQCCAEEGEPAPLEARPGAALGTLYVTILIILTIGGIWTGHLTPTEAAAVGLFGSVVIALLKGMTPAMIFNSVQAAGAIVVPILLLILGASIYTKVLALEGIPDLIASLFSANELDVVTTMLIFVAVWLILGFFVDSISVMLLTVPIFWPIASALGIDPIVFGLVGILAIEAGVLTPPFGLAVFVVHSAIPGDVSLGQIFKGATPYWLLILLNAWIVWTFPAIATWLPAQL